MILKGKDILLALGDGKTLRSKHHGTLYKIDGNLLLASYEKKEFEDCMLDFEDMLRMDDLIEYEEEVVLDLYFQWISLADHELSTVLMTISEAGDYSDQMGEIYQIFGGPWVKTEDGFRRHESFQHLQS